MFFKLPPESGGGGDGILLLNTPHHHAHVHGLDDDGHTLWFQGIVDGVEDVEGEALLNLETTSKHVHHSWDFAQADDITIGDVGDMGLA